MRPEPVAELLEAIRRGRFFTTERRARAVRHLPRAHLAPFVQLLPPRLEAELHASRILDFEGAERLLREAEAACVIVS
jgi:hypothetical protein